MSVMRLAAQLYTLRNYTKTLDGFAETLKKVAQIGYKIVQVSGTCDYEADWLREQQVPERVRPCRRIFCLWQ